MIWLMKMLHIFHYFVFGWQRKSLVSHGEVLAPSCAQRYLDLDEQFFIPHPLSTVSEVGNFWWRPWWKLPRMGCVPASRGSEVYPPPALCGI